MKLLKKILIIFLAGFALCFAIAYVYVLFNGKAIVISRLENLTGRKVTIDYIGVSPPLNLVVKNLNIEGLIRADSLSIAPSVFTLFSGTFIVDNLNASGLEVTYEKKFPSLSALPTNLVLVSAEMIKPVTPANPGAGTQSRRPVRFALRHVNIRNGKINFIDHTAGNGGIRLAVKDVRFNLRNLYLFPHSAATNFKFTGRIPWQAEKEEGRIEAEGWLNLFKKDMQASVKISDIDGIYLYPYYATWVDLEKTRIESAKLNFTSNIKGENNDVTADCHLELTDIVFKPRPAEETADKAEKIATAVLDIFKVLSKGKIVFNFKVKTTMDKFGFRLSDVKDEFEKRLAEGIKNNRISAQDIAMLPARVVGGTVKGAADLSKAMVDTTFSLGSELKKAVFIAFDRKNNKKE